jgi:peroxiredoxin
MKRLLPLLIGLVGAVCGMSVVIGGLYVALEYTTLFADPAAVISPVETAATSAPSGLVELPPLVATVNGEAITRQMVEAELKISRLNVSEPLAPLTGQDLARGREEAINQLVTRHLILQDAARQGYILTDEFVQQRADLLFGSSGEEALVQALAEVGASREEMLWWVREIFTVEGYTTEMIMGDVAPEARQQVYNDWLNIQRSTAEVKTYLDGSPQSTAALIGQPAPDFTLSTPEGQQRSLADYRGQVVLVNFWATWCSSCIAELPEYEEIYQKHGQGQGQFMVLGINLQESPEQAAQYAAGLGLTFPVLLDQDGSVTTHHYQATGMPASIIVDPQGQIFYRHLGPMSGATLEAKLAELGL